MLLNQDKNSPISDERKWTNEDLTKLGFSTDGDRTLIESVLKFTCMLLEHCGNRSIYASSAHLNDLLHSTSLTVLIATLKVGVELAQRYQASVKRIGNASRQISTALLANHYQIDLDRVQQLALPFVKTPIVSLSDPVHSHTPGSTSKGKDKSHANAAKSSTSMHANDLVALIVSDDKRWNGWGDIKMSYYPQYTSQEPTVHSDQGRQSMPSTPTPLRRSSTMTSQQQTPRSRNNFGDDSSPIGSRTPGISEEYATPGQKSFDIPQSVVLSTPMPDLVSRCPADLPVATKYEAFNRLRVAKALLSSQDSRQQLLAVRLLAITNLAFIHTESNFVEKVLRQDVDEPRRFQLVYQLAELIHPSTDGNVSVPMWLQAITFTLLEAISNFQARCQDVLSALNANVNHGILLYVIRKAVAGMKEDDPSYQGDQVTEADEWRNSLFAMTLHLSMSTRVGSEMVSAGLMEILVEILNIRSAVAQRIHSMVLAFLDALIWTYQNAFTAFFNAKGLDAVAQLLVDTVTEAQKLRKEGQGMRSNQQSNAVDYEIPYFQQQTLRWLLKFVHHVMSNSYSYSGNTDRLLRNLADKSDLLASLRDIIEDKKSFGSLVWTNSVTILSDFINNDPTSFAAISESGMIRTYLEAITGRPISKDLVDEPKTNEKDEGEGEGEDAETPDSTESFLDQDDRPHPPTQESLQKRFVEPLAVGILPSTDAISVVPQVLNSISLNNIGMKMVVASRAFDSFFEIFESPAHVKCMETDSDLANNVGASFDELARHHPPLRSSISNAVIDMVARVRFLAIEKARTEGWGTKLLLVNSSGNTISADEGAQSISASKSSEKANAGDMDVDMSDVQTDQKQPQEDGDAPKQSVTSYIFAFSSFLNAYVSNSTLKASFVEQGGLELLLDICEAPSLPTDFGDSLASRILNQVVSQLIEQSPIRGLPSLLKRTQNVIDTLQPLASKTEAVPPYFAPFLVADLATVREKSEFSEVIRNGNKMVKALLNAQTLIKIISDCFPTSRSNNLQFYNVNVYDYYLKLVKSLGPLLRGVLAEEAGELSAIPQHWAFRRSGPSAEESSKGSNAPGLEGDDSASLPALLNNTGTWKSPAGADSSSPSSPTDQEQASPRFQNYETLRLLLHPMIPTAFPLFQTLGKALLPRRERNAQDPFPRPRHLEIARALADTVLDQLRPSVANPEPTSKDFHFWIIMLHTIAEMLIDHRKSYPSYFQFLDTNDQIQASTRPTDRSSVQVIVPVLLAFKDQGGLDVLNCMLKVFSKAVQEGPESVPDESSKSKVAAFGLKKILDLYLTLVNGKYLAEASALYGLQPRTSDRSQSTLNVSQQFVVEFRAAILPEIIELWGSEFVEKVPHQTVVRLLDILKLIANGDNEPQSSSRDKVRMFLITRQHLLISI